jgi:hypothetical protein
MAHRYTSEEAAAARRARGAHAANRVVRAQGRVPAAEATAARMLRRIALQENEQLSGDLDPASSVVLNDVLDGID